ncbi:Nucleoporin NIC96 [Penicillium ucsense]|nr:Nucleoporin NIC96 [Penicillium ucsense]
MASNTGSLFGGASGLGSATNKPSLFGSTNTATSAFGTTPAAPAQTTQTSSLFGQSQAQPQPTAQSSLFGQPPAQAQPTTQSSLFGQSQAPAQQPAQSSLLGQPQQQANGAQASGAAAQATQPAFFKSLLERGKKRPLSAAVQGSNFADVPNLQLGLDDIRRKARELGSGGNKDPLQPGVTKKAHYLLASSGISPGQALRDLRLLDPQASVAPVREADTFDPDNQRFLRNIQQRGRQVMINESLSRAQRDFDAFLEDKLDMDWEEQRQKIFQHFGLEKDAGSGEELKSTMRGAFGRSARQSKAPGGPAASRRSVYGRSGLDKSVIGTPGAGLASRQLFEPPTERAEGASPSSPDSRFLREKMGYYAEKVQDLNFARLQGKTYPVLGQFMEVEMSSGGDVPQQLVSAYRALISIVQESPGITDKSDPRAVRERQFASEYLDESPKSRSSIKLKNKILQGTRTYLEKAFYSEVENAIAKNPREAQLGGIPSTINKIRAYIRLRAARKDLAPDGTELQTVDDDYCWILIFYLLRCGFVEEAASYAASNQSFRSLDLKFVTYVTSYARDRRLSRENQQKINGEFQQRSRNAPENTVDPYRMACYKIIGRCDLSRRRLEGINQSVEDWMWLQFSLAREDDRAEEVAGDIFGLEDIQTDIAEIGQRVFNKNNAQDSPGGYGTFFLLQILGGMFEQAVAYLGTFAPVTAVHFAVALAYYGLLRVSDFYTSGEEILSFSVKQYPQINFGYLITQYTREFRTGYVEAAVDYFTLICLNADLGGNLGKSQASVCHEALREFILETRDFAKLLGDIRDDGTRIKGIIEQRLALINLSDQEDFLKNITVQAAGVADDKGLITDAVLLYHLAENYDRVIDIINRALSDAIAMDLGASMPKLQPLRPRVQEGQSGPADPGSSLSLTAVEDPVELGRTMIGLYDGKPMYYEKIRPINRDSCGLLLRMLTAKYEVEAGRWAPALDCINALNILPLQAQGQIQNIRSAAQNFSSLPEMISRNVGHVIMWSITCIGNERHRQTSGPYETDMHQGFADQLLQMAKDLMIFSGMVKYKLPPRVYEALARAGAEIGAY